MTQVSLKFDKSSMLSFNLRDNQLLINTVIVLNSRIQTAAPTLYLLYWLIMKLRPTWRSGDDACEEEKEQTRCDRGRGHAACPTVKLYKSEDPAGKSAHMVSASGPECAALSCGSVAQRSGVKSSGRSQRNSTS